MNLQEVSDTLDTTYIADKLVVNDCGHVLLQPVHDV